jgi:hypothetical protein
MTTTPRQMRRIDSNPPPLDLGAPGSPTAHYQTSSDEATLPIGPSSAGGMSMTPRLGRSVAFQGSSNEAAPTPGLTCTAASPELRSSEEGHRTDNSSAPLNEAGPSKSRLQDKLKLSPKATLSPRPEGSMARSPNLSNAQKSPRGGQRSLRTSYRPAEADVQDP